MLWLSLPILVLLFSNTPLCQLHYVNLGLVILIFSIFEQENKHFFVFCIAATYNHWENIWDKLSFSCEIGSYEKSSISTVQAFLVCIEKIFILALVYYFSKFWDFPDFSYFLKFFQQLVRQLLYTMFVAKNRASFNLWEENLVKHQKVSKYENDCLQNFILLFMTLLTAPIVTNSHI